MITNVIALPGLDRVKNNRGWFLLLGILLILVGWVAIGEAFFMTVFSMRILGWLMIFSGAAGAIHAWTKERGWGGFFFDLVTGILYVVGGFLILSNLTATAVVLTLLIAFLLIFEGLFRIIAAISVRAPNWGWTILHGFISLALGIMIWQRWPVAGLWVIGLFVGISLIFRGFNWIGVGMALRSLPRPGAA